MNRIIYLTILSFFLINEIKCQDVFTEDINGDQKTDILSIINDNGKGLKIKQFYSGHQLWKFNYLNEFYFPISNQFSSYLVADITGNGRSNIIIFSNNGKDKDMWFFTIEPNKLVYIGHTLLENGSDTKEFFADINGDKKEELILVQDARTNKIINTYAYENGDFYLKDSLNTTGNPRKEHFADITGDGKDDLILSQDYGNDKRIWTFKSNGSTFEYLAYTNLISDAGKEVFFINSNNEKDSFSDLVLSKETIEGKKLWLFESDGARFNYEVSNTLQGGNGRTLLFEDIDQDKTDDLIATDRLNNIWTYESTGNLFNYRLHTPLNYDGILPTNRKVDWHNAGYQGGKSIPSTFKHFVQMPPPSNDPKKNDDNLAYALQQAVTLKGSFPNEHIVIQFQTGTYSFNKQIVLNVFKNHSHIILRGKGFKTSDSNDFTELVYNISPEVTEFGNHFININGSRTYPTNSEAPQIINYDELNNEITLNKKIGISDGKEWLLELLFTNGKWHSPDNCAGLEEPNEYTGLITSANLVSGTTYKLEKDFSKSWNLFKDETNIAKAYKFLPIKEVGLGQLSLRYDEDFQNVENNNINSTLISINRTKNCWVDNIEVTKVLSAGLGIGQSMYAEVRNSYFHEAYNYGGGGRAYGVVVGSRSILCKVENNIFRKLRHAMQVSFGSNHNVFGYNYSREQTDQLGNSLGDLNLHGFYPYANLFEGNMVDRIHGDACFGPNGAYNTFFRNHTSFNQLRIDEMLYTNIIDNKNASIIGNDETSFLLNNFNYNVYNNLNLIKEYNYLPEASYYLDEVPDFFKEFIDTYDVSWPAIGSPTLDESIIQNIPAKEIWFGSLANNISSRKKNKFYQIKKKDESDYIIYPNPNKENLLQIKLKDNLQSISIHISSINGKTIYRRQNNTTLKNTITVDVSNFSQGIYIVSIKNNGKTIHKKLIIE